MRPDALIVGGGIAGLSAAYELSRRGLRACVIEGRPRPGGLILSERVAGFTIDAGPDSLLVQKPAAVDLCREIGLGDRLQPTKEPRRAFVLRHGRLHPLPDGSVLGIPTSLSALAASGLFSTLGKARMAAEVLVPRRRVAGQDESIGAFVRRRFGEEAVTYLAEPLLAGIHAGDVERLSIRALFPRLADVERLHGSLIRGFRRLGSAPADGLFRSLPGGIGEIVAALLSHLPAGTVRCGTVVRHVNGRGPYSVQLADGTVCEGRVLILAVPGPAAADLLAPLDPDLADLCHGIPYASSATVTLAYPRPAVGHPLEGSGFVVPRSEHLAIMAASWVSSKWPDRAPANTVLLRAFVGGTRDPQALMRSDDELQSIVEKELGGLLGIDGAPLLARVHRWERASPQYEVGHLDRVASIDRALGERPGLYLTGSAYRGVGIPDCVADGRATARAAAAHLNT